ncbi:diaminopimelate decarboxylase [Brevibacterium iodinum]|uniref:diaminopimelate decarboxylase n=1 Tax=Brevibacterium iodinum TaxID=31943 RepID=UPI001FCA18D3|nr:diaminopimelate decarboxylase [Brevibacterium iodinum]
MSPHRSADPAHSAHASAPSDSAPAQSDSAPAHASAQSDSVPALTDEAAVIGLMDLDWVDTAFDRLTSAFASNREVLHAVACKAVPLPSLLRRFAEAGAGCEVASPGELELALSAGFAADRIVFDSPAKTWAELWRAVDLGVSINVDNFDELSRLDTILADRNSTAASAKIGIRINPQSGTGAIGALSTATETSKFGIGLADPGAREALIEAYLARPWLSQIHVHSGSQGISLDKAAVGIRAAVDLAEEINSRASTRRITRIDIGGGLSVNFDGEDITPTFADYRSVLEGEVAGLFEFDIVTEFGRALLAKAGTILTRVEYAKTTGGRRIVMTQAGVQVATRTSYAPNDWPLRILPFTSDGNPKTAEEADTEIVPTDVAGPACFSGDLLARDRMLPRLDAGDLVAVPETGAYYFSNPFSYNLLPRVPIFGYRTATDGGIEFSLIRRGQAVAEILAEAGETELRPLSPANRGLSPEGHALSPHDRETAAEPLAHGS